MTFLECDDADWGRSSSAEFPDLPVSEPSVDTSGFSMNLVPSDFACHIAAT
jgi:hypothetical protein